MDREVIQIAPDLVEQLVGAAENVLARWNIIRVTDGKLGACGLPEAMAELELVLERISPDEDTQSDDGECMYVKTWGLP